MNKDADKKKIYGLLGKNIKYSLSPAMHNAAFRKFGINAEYKIFDKQENELEDFFKEYVYSGKLSGFNITVPYKIKVKEILERDGIKPDAYTNSMGAVNTVKIDGGKPQPPTNTDGDGFCYSLKEDAGFDVDQKTVLVLGAGGAGRVICLSLLRHLHYGSARMVSVYDKDKEKSDSLKDLVPGILKGTRSSIGDRFCSVGTHEDMLEKAKEVDLLVNATPLGTKEGDDMPVDPAYLKEGTVVYDLVYARKTELIKAAREKGLTAVNGLGMLIDQAALAFRIWTGKPLSEISHIMREAALNELKKREK